MGWPIQLPDAAGRWLLPPIQSYPVRNEDHKFEWTRAEFHAWADGLGAQYGYTCTYHGVGGGSLLAGIASTIKATSPQTRVIAVEPRDADMLSRSLLSGHRVADEKLTKEQRADGIFVSQISAEVYRLCQLIESWARA